MKLEKYLSKLGYIQYKWQVINTTPITEILVIRSLGKDDLTQKTE